MFKKKKDVDLQNEEKQEVDTSSETLEETPKKSKKGLFIGLSIVVILGAGAFIALQMLNSKTPVPNPTPAPKPSSTPVVVEETAEPTEEPESTEEVDASANPDSETTTTMTEEDKTNCALVTKTVTTALKNAKVQAEVAKLGAGKDYTFYVKATGVADSGPILKTVLAKYLAKLAAPTTKGHDSYQVTVSPVKNVYSNVNVVTSKYGTADLGTEVKKEADAEVDKMATDTDKSTCASIESCINAALAEETVYKESAKYIVAKKAYIFEIRTATKMNPQPLMKKELLNSLKDLPSPKEPGKNTYYVLIEGTTKGNVTTIGDVYVMTGVIGKVPTAAEFKSTKK